MRKYFFLFALVAVFACNEHVSSEKITDQNSEQISDVKKDLPPNLRFGELFKEIQMTQVFPDGKTFVDCIPKMTTKEIMSNYNDGKKQPNFNLKNFVAAHFDTPKIYASGFKADTTKSVEQHINSLWPVLTRQPDAASTGSLFPLPNSYIVPGGRFGEIYYWDSYFTMLGLQSAGKIDMIENMIKNFAYLIDKVGFIPNGNRTYFLSRSQPPFFGKMVGLLAESKGDKVIQTYLPQLEKEYQFWMDGAEKVSKENPVHKKVVLVGGDFVLNRYWDKGDYPRAESYKEDIETVKESNRPEKEVYQDLRSACESGWDFSSRWFKDEKTLTTIHTTDIIPVDLNCLLFSLESIIAKGHQLNGNDEKKQEYLNASRRRKAGMRKYCWDSKAGFYRDYDFANKQHTPVLSLAGMYPLECGIATEQQATKCAAVIKNQFLKPGGVVSTLNNTGQQWDAPNGWAPLQWMTIKGLRNYNENELADEIKNRWVTLNKKVYKNTGKLVEKYNVLDMTLDAGGGEYPVQDGFGWTNGVLLKLLKE